ncbi:MAG: PhnD/SsuA/transferrin family substrate-binding protein [Rhodocyclaceae bacterium]|nr:PhnD/SsuA/transferrin family substrate-binding protein [Rhodocyclaceae bacterium]
MRGPILSGWSGRVLLLFWLMVFPLVSQADWPEERPIRIGVNAAALKQHPEVLPEWQRYLSDRLKRPVVFVHRDTYRQMIDVIKQREVDFAWLSTFPYAYMAHRGRVKLLVIPVPRGKSSSYSAYLLVPASDTQTRSIEDLRGRVFAFTDPYSLTGYQVARFWLRHLSEPDPKRYFRKTFFTHSHRNTMTAVAAGLADGGMVDSYAWEMAVHSEPQLAGEIRIVTRSVDYGFPPVVAVSGASAKDAAALRDTLLAMDKNDAGRRLLQGVGLSGFEIGDSRRYRNLAAILESADQP